MKKIYLNFLPMKCELLVWKNSFKHFLNDFRWKNFISIPYFYILRILLINKFLASNKKLPYSIGSKNLELYESCYFMWWIRLKACRRN